MLSINCPPVPNGFNLYSTPLYKPLGEKEFTSKPNPIEGLNFLAFVYKRLSTKS